MVSSTLTENENGGCCRLHRNVPISHASVSQLKVSNAIWWELERRLVLIYLGKSHHSSQKHEMVIREMEYAGSDNSYLQELYTAVPRSGDAVCAGDFKTLSQEMIDIHESQHRLHF